MIFTSFLINILPLLIKLLYNDYDNKLEVITLAKKQSTKKSTQQTNHPDQKHYKTPTETWWGKLIVWIILFGMVGLIILSLVVAIISGNS